MAISEFNAALNQVASERGISVESIIESIKAAIIIAYKKDRKEHGEDVEAEDLVAEINTDTVEIKVLNGKKDVTPSGFGRIAAQTAKQVINQKIRETEKENIYTEFKGKIGQIVTGTVFKIENNVITLDLGKTHVNGVMLQSEQVPTESYRINQRLKVVVRDVREGPKGMEILVSRSDAELVVRLFEQEVPEIASGTVTIEAIAREAGSRTKMAVVSRDEKVDPVGSCVGQKGVRVQSIISELFGEKIDIIQYSPIAEKFISAALAPAKVIDVELDKANNKAEVTVPEDQQSLAIGKEGQNARLANKLTKWKIDIKGVAGFSSEVKEDEKGSKKDTHKKIVGIWDDVVKAVKKEDEEKAAKKAQDTADAKTSEETPADDANKPAAEEQPAEPQS